jgi:hypothetical protein
VRGGQQVFADPAFLLPCHQHRPRLLESTRNTPCNAPVSPASSHRHWSPERFLGRDGVRYIVTGKGGLRREVMIPHDLAGGLEARRLEAARGVTDRGITYCLFR